MSALARGRFGTSVAISRTLARWRLSAVRLRGQRDSRNHLNQIVDRVGVSDRSRNGWGHRLTDSHHPSRA